MKWLIGLLLTVLMGIGIAIGLPFKQKDTLCFTPPTTNTDGSPLTDLMGFKMFWSKTSGSFMDANSKDVGMGTVSGTERCASISTNAGPLNGIYYFVLTAYNTARLESAFSNEVSATFSKVPRPVTNTVLQ